MVRIVKRFNRNRRTGLLTHPGVQRGSNALARLLAAFPAPVTDRACALSCLVAQLLVGASGDEVSRVQHGLRCSPAQAQRLIERRRVLALRAKVDVLRWRRAPRRYAGTVRREGEQHLLAALAPRKGLVLITIHTAGLAAAAWPLADFVQQHGASISIVTGATLLPSVLPRAPAFDNPSTVRALVNDLKGGALVLVLADAFWYQGRRTAVRPFLNTLCRFPVGPIAISRLAQATILPAVALSEGRGRYVMRFYPPIDPPARSDQAGERRVLDAIVDLFEAVIRAYPEQYMVYPWFEPQPSASGTGAPGPSHPNVK